MGKKVLLMLTLALALPMAAFADSDIIFTATGGTITGSSYGMSLSGDQITGITGAITGTFNGSNLGTLTFTTDKMHSGGNVIVGATFFAPGGSVTITGTGADGAPAGVLFSGAFSQDPVWVKTTQPDGSVTYTFTGIATGILADGSTTADFLIQVVVNKQYNPKDENSLIFTGSSKITYATATSVRVPEPSSLAFLGTGLVGVIGAIRRKYKGSQSL